MGSFANCSFGLVLPMDESQPQLNLFEPSLAGNSTSSSFRTFWTKYLIDEPGEKWGLGSADLTKFEDTHDPTLLRTHLLSTTTISYLSIDHLQSVDRLATCHFWLFLKSRCPYTSEDGSGEQNLHRRAPRRGARSVVGTGIHNHRQGVTRGRRPLLLVVTPCRFQGT